MEREREKNQEDHIERRKKRPTERKPFSSSPRLLSGIRGLFSIAALAALVSTPHDAKQQALSQAIKPTPEVAAEIKDIKMIEPKIVLDGEFTNEERQSINQILFATLGPISLGVPELASKLQNMNMYLILTRDLRRSIPELRKKIREIVSGIEDSKLHEAGIGENMDDAAMAASIDAHNADAFTIGLKMQVGSQQRSYYFIFLDVHAMADLAKTIAAVTHELGHVESLEEHVQGFSNLAKEEADVFTTSTRYLEMIARKLRELEMMVGNDVPSNTIRALEEEAIPNERRLQQGWAIRAGREGR